MQGAEATAEPCRAKYLVADDKPCVARSLRRVLGRRGKVDEKYSCKSARESFADLALYDAVFLDVEFPDGSGLDLLAELRERDFAIPVCVLSAYDDHEILRTAQLHHALFLPKPSRVSHVLAFADWAEVLKPLRRAASAPENAFPVVESGVVPRLGPGRGQAAHAEPVDQLRGESAAQGESAAHALAVRELVRAVCDLGDGWGMSPLLQESVVDAMQQPRAKILAPRRGLSAHNVRDRRRRVTQHAERREGYGDFWNVVVAAAMLTTSRLAQQLLQHANLPTRKLVDAASAVAHGREKLRARLEGELLECDTYRPMLKRHLR